MKKKIALLLAVVMIFSFCACNGGNQNSQTTKEESSFEEPIVLLDNEYGKIIATGKISRFDETFGKDVLGYSLIIENKSDIYTCFVPVNCSVDGFMTDLQEGPFLGNDIVGPGKKSNTTMFFIVDMVNSIELQDETDLKNFDGKWQLTFSKDGQGYSDVTFFDFENVIP